MSCWPAAARSLLIDDFLSRVDAEDARERVAEVAARRLDLDPHLLEASAARWSV